MAGNSGNSLLAFVFDDPFKAEEARAALHRMEGEGWLEIDESAIISKRADGKTRASQDVDVVHRDQHVGHVAGIIAGVITGTMPFILAGTVAGKLVSMLTDNGITDRFCKQVSAELTPGTSALILYGRSDEARRGHVRDKLMTFGAKLIESDLPDDVEQAINAALIPASSG
jgi:uncharacterized membrane protein